MKTSKLTGAALDWAVAKAENKLDVCGEVALIGNQLWCYEDGEKKRYIPSTSWAQGGHIIEREFLEIRFLGTSEGKYGMWLAKTPTDHNDQSETGSTPLIAAMRCYVASKLGDYVEIPKQLN